MLYASNYWSSTTNANYPHSCVARGLTMATPAPTISTTASMSGACAADSLGHLIIWILASQLTTKATSSTKIVLSWIDNSDNETGFIIERKAGACDSASPWVQIITKGANITTHTNTGLSPNTTYSYRVRTYNDAGNSLFTNCTSAKTALSGTPKAPTYLKAASVSSIKVNLSWKDNSTDEASFKIYRKTGTGAWVFFNNGRC